VFFICSSGRISFRGVVFWWAKVFKYGGVVYGTTSGELWYRSTNEAKTRYACYTMVFETNVVQLRYHYR
jgi:hypothetical protein